MKCRALESNAQDKFNAAGAGRLLRPRYGLVPALPVNGWQASRIRHRLRQQPRDAADECFRESTSPVLGAIALRLACAIAQSRASGCRCRRDCFHPPAASLPAIALATLRSPRSRPASATARYRIRPRAGAGDRPGSGEYGVSWIAPREPCVRAGAGICRPRRSRGSVCPRAPARDGQVDAGIVTASREKRRSGRARVGLV